ncbi:hypothetical protein N0V90_000584 [Kalmusia sp. IMI 367209]|nr:hypothetical protein N0V90_000584 [Kalmusia sp. IMI 367209]
MTKELDLFNPTCPENSKWYACKATAANRSPFVGCCASDPCSISGCSLGNLTPVSFNASAYGSLPDPSCGAASTFYSCINMPKNDTTFWGCCKSDPCNHQDNPDDKSCPKGDLTPAVLDNANQQSAYGASEDGAKQVEGEGSHSHTGVIIGGAVGGGVAIVAIIAILIFCLCKRRRARSRRGSMSSKTGIPVGEKTDYRHSAYSEAPPMYDSPKPPHSLFPAAAFGQHQYTQVAQSTPQELPADFTAGPVQRYSELPAEAHAVQVNQAPVEMESPVPSPRPLFSPLSPPRSPLAHGGSSPDGRTYN